MSTVQTARRASAHAASQLVLVPTPIGDVALVHRGGALIGAKLPGPDFERQLGLTWGDVDLDGRPPAWVARAGHRIAAHLSGRLDPLTDLPVDLSALTPFRRAVLEAARRIPPGEVRTYGDLAAEVGKPGAARAVGGAMGSNPIPLVIPCHRVVAAGGIGGFSGAAGCATKRALLAIEGVVGL